MASKRRRRSRQSSAYASFAGAAPRPRWGAGGLPGAGDAARAGRCAATALRAFRHEESRGPPCTVCKPGVRSDRADPGGSLPPCGEAHADGGAAGGGVRAAECARAFSAAASAGAASGAGRCEFGALVRRVEGACAAAWAVCGHASRTRSGAVADLAAVQGLAAHRADRSGRGAGRLAGPPWSHSTHGRTGLGRGVASVKLTLVRVAPKAGCHRTRSSRCRTRAPRSGRNRRRRSSPAPLPR